MTPPVGSGNGVGGAPPDAEDAGRDADARGGDGDPELAAMRSVWLSMRDEEPPDRGLAELLAAARIQAEAMAPKPSWWQRLLAALRRPPLLALVTVLVLLGGAVLLGRRVGRDSAPAMHPPAPVVPTDGAAPAGPAVGSGSAAVRSVDPLPRVQADTGEAERSLDASRPSRPPRSPLPPAVHAAPRAEAPPPPPDVGLVARSGSADDTRALLIQQCDAAARRGDCPVVRRLVEQISQTDPGYRARVVQDAAFARCLE